MKIKLSILAAFGMLFIMSCGSSVSDKDQMANFIPGDAGVVVRVKPDVLMEKADFEAMKKMEFFQDGLKEAQEESEALAAILENPVKSGINLEKSSFLSLFFKGEKDPGIGIYIPLSDRSKFEELLETLTADFEKTELTDGSLFADNEGSIVVKDNMAILIFEDKGDYTSFIGDKENSVVRNSNFTKFLKGKGDMSYWMSSAPFMEMMGTGEMVRTLKMFKEEDLKNNYSHGHVVFGDGMIDMQGKVDLSRGLKSDLSLVFGKGVDHDFSKDFPAENLQGIYTVSISLKGTYQLTKEYFMSGMVESEIEDQLGLSIDEFTNAFSGEMAMGFYINPEAFEEAGKKEPGFVYALDIGKKKYFNKLINNLVEKGVLMQDGDSYSLPGGMGRNKGKFIHRKDVFYMVASKDPALMDKISSGKFEKSSDIQKKIKKISKNHLFGFILQPSFLASVDDIELPDLVEQLVSMEGASGMSDGFFNVEFKNKSVNSLKMFMEAINKSYLKDKEKKKEREKKYPKDAVDMPQEVMEM